MVLVLIDASSHASIRASMNLHAHVSSGGALSAPLSVVKPLLCRPVHICAEAKQAVTL